MCSVEVMAHIKSVGVSVLAIAVFPNAFSEGRMRSQARSLPQRFNSYINSLSRCHNIPSASKGERRCLPPGKVMCGTVANTSKPLLC
jgi:hypothetical protein